jgi:hypothetical protein
MQLPYERRNKLTAELAAEIAISVLNFLASDSERLERFLSLSGLGPHNLRKAAAEPTFLGAVLDYVAGDEALLLEFAESAGLDPSRVAAAREALVPTRSDL